MRKSFCLRIKFVLYHFMGEKKWKLNLNWDKFLLWILDSKLQINVQGDSQKMITQHFLSKKSFFTLIIDYNLIFFLFWQVSNFHETVSSLHASRALYPGWNFKFKLRNGWNWKKMSNFEKIEILTKFQFVVKFH